MVFLLGMACAPSVSAQEKIWITVDAAVPVTKGDMAAAKQQAHETAERKAVAEALTPGISIQKLLVNLRLSGSIVGVIPFGQITEKQILEEGPLKKAAKGSAQKAPSYHVKMKAAVVRQNGEQDPSFHIDAAIDRNTLTDGEELQISLRSTKACYFAIFNILEDNKIIRLLPNELSKKNHLASGETFRFPDSNDRKKGLKLRVHLPEDKQQVTESIYILALDRSFKLDTIGAQEGIFGVFNGQTAFLKDLIREVVAIPLKDRAEALLQYEIRQTNTKT
jgi:hypothetical protein